MLYFLVTMVESSSETSHSASNDSMYGRAMLYRSEIDDHGAEISPVCHFSAGGPTVPIPMFSGKSGAVRRDLHQSERSKARWEAIGT